MKERRQIGGITKEAFLSLVAKEGGNVELEALKFDMRQCMVGKIELLKDRFDNFEKACPNDCEQHFDKRYFKQKYAIWAGIAIVFTLIGYGTLTLTDVIKTLK